MMMAEVGAMPEALKSEKSKGPQISRELFGGVLDYDGAGHYPGLELLNFVFCVEGGTLPVAEQVKIKRRSNDFGRRLVWDDTFNDDQRRRDVLLDDPMAENTLREVMRCLQLEIPSKPKEVSWSRAHFFPFTPSLIHWDAREKNGIKLERRYFRGGGALAFKILRSDADEDRLQRIRAGFDHLYAAAADGAMETLADFINEQSVDDEQPVPDQIEQHSQAGIDAFEDIYRDGVLNILEQRGVMAVAKIRAVMGWTGVWLVLMQHRRASKKLDLEPEPIICDCGADRAPLRRGSQRSLHSILTNITDSVYAVDASISAKQRDKIRSFFWATAAANGLLNAWKGRKHFTLSIDALEMIVLSAVPEGTEMSFERFVHEILHGNLGFAVGREAAEATGLIHRIDASVFEENEAQLARQMIAAGLVTEYSDATRMVRPKALS